MFGQATMDQLADAIATRLEVLARLRPPALWPELMSVEAAAKYIDRTPSAIHHLIEARLFSRLPADLRVKLANRIKATIIPKG